MLNITCYGYYRPLKYKNNLMKKHTCNAPDHKVLSSKDLVFITAAAHHVMVQITTK